MIRPAVEQATNRPVPTRRLQGRSLPAGWHLVDINELTTRLQSLDVSEDDITAWLDDLAARGVRNPASYTRRLPADELLSDVTNTLAAQGGSASVFAGHLDYSRNYRRAPRRQVVTGR